MDAFIDKLDLQQLGFINTVHKSEGRPPYSPAVLLKLYLYGYLNKIRSSRKLGTRNQTRSNHHNTAAQMSLLQNRHTCNIDVFGKRGPP
jgi:transposase